MANFFAGLGIVESSRHLAKWTRPQSSAAFAGYALVAMATVLAAAFPALASHHAAFLNDHRQQLADYVERELSQHANIAAEYATGLVRPDRKATTRTVRAAHFVPDLGTLDELRAQGVTHVAVSDLYRRSFFLGERDNRRGIKNDTTEKHRLFYKRLLSEGKLIFEKRQGRIRAISPVLRLYEIAPVKEPATIGP